MRRFDAADDHDADGHATTAKWAEAKTRLGGRDAKAAVRQMRLLARHPLLDAATATGAITISWAREIAAWTGRIDHDGLQSAADSILVEAAAAGADLDDLKLLAQAAYEAWRAQEPDPEDDPHGEGVPLTGPCSSPPPSTTPGHLRGDLTPECSAALAAVLDALGKSRGPRGPAHRPAALPRRPPGSLRAPAPRQDGPRPGGRRHPRGCDHPAPRDLLGMDGASAVEDTWLRARAGEHGYLSGRDAEAISLRRDDRPGRHRLPGLGPDHRDDPP